MERLTKRIGNHYCYADACKDCTREDNSCDGCPIRKLINRVGELEDMIKQIQNNNCLYRGK